MDSQNKSLRFTCVLVLICAGYVLRNIYSVRGAAGDRFAYVGGSEDLERLSSSIAGEYCFVGMERRCMCRDPMEPVATKAMPKSDTWRAAFRKNVDAASGGADGADVVFYGDSITEGWMGTSQGVPNPRKAKNLPVFDSLFSRGGGGRYDALVLGIAADTATNLLWRLRNGEMPDSLRPKVFWVLIGTNDLGVSWCSPEAALLGILRVVEEIRARRPGAPVVINGLMPRSFDEGGHVMRTRDGKKFPELWTAIRDINTNLRAYSENYEEVSYFDANDVFLLEGRGGEVIDKRLMGDFVHPSPDGYRLWGDRIVQKLDQMLE